MPAARAKKPRVTREAVAYHEAGHAVIGLQYRQAVRRIVMTPDEELGSLAAVHRFRRPTFLADVGFYAGGGWKQAVPRLLSLFAGQVAEWMYTGEWDKAGAGQDNELAWEYCDRATNSHAEAKALYRWAFERTKNELASPRTWMFVLRVARELVTRDRMEGREVKELCKFPDGGDRDGLRRAREEMEAARLDLVRIQEREEKATQKRKKARKQGRKVAP